MAHYRSLTEWHVEAPVDRVWGAILDYRRWPDWWKGFTTVEQLRPGDDSGVGTVLRQGWRSLLPYTLTFDLEITGVERHARLGGKVTGDLEGSCAWTFEPGDGTTVVGFLMDVHPARWWMNLPVPFAKRIFAANVDAVMGWGGEGLGRLLGADVIHRTAEAAAPSTAAVPASHAAR
jgi:hypothetical protein